MCKHVSRGDTSVILLDTDSNVLFIEQKLEREEAAKCQNVGVTVSQTAQFPDTLENHRSPWPLCCRFDTTWTGSACEGLRMHPSQRAVYEQASTQLL